MSSLDLDAIEARAQAATEGPWIAVQRETQYGHVSDVASMKRELGPSFDFVPIVAQSSAAVDAAFIAHARVDVPALVAALRERDNTITRVREVLDAEGFGYTNFIPRLRAALDPQETP